MRLAGALLLAASTLVAQTKPLTIEQLLSSPFPSELVASRAGGHIAWIQSAQGQRNVWVASPPEYQARQLTSYKEDDGIELSGLQFTADGLTILFVRGGSANSRGEIPNPTSNPAGAEQSVWAVAVAGGEVKRIAEGTGVIAAKDRALFLSKGQVMAAPLTAEGKAEPLLKVRGQASSLRLSPDGSLLAFVSGRGDHSYIGLYDLNAKTLRWVSPSLDRDVDPVFSPDGKSLAYLRIPSSRDLSIFGPKRSSDPWSIRIADVTTGQSRLVFRADPGRGSVYSAIVGADQILWTTTAQIVFPWERDGWRHLYSIATTGEGGPRLLTHGEFEVEHVAMTPDGKEVVYSSNADDIDRRHLFRVAAGGGPANPITSGKGIEWSPAVTSDGKAIAYIRSDAKLPARVAIQSAFGSARDLVPFEFPADALVEPQPVQFSAADGMRIRGQLFLPANGNSERKPAVIFFHGGSRRQMLLGWHYRGYYHNAYAFNQYLANRGYIVLSVNYRSGTGYGLEFREALNYGATGASEFNDVLGAGLYLQSRTDVDPRRIALWGGSYGGYLTALGLARASNLFAAGVDIHGVHNWNEVIRNFVPSYDPEAQQSAAKLAFDSSPMAHVKGWRSPVLLIHGDDDRNVPFSESVTLAEALRQQGVEYEQVVFPDEVHDFLRHSRWVEAFRAAAAFLDRRMKR
jgi:dipeptidyl aminopeptidase/acylaminoacyl peptidase